MDDSVMSPHSVPGSAAATSPARRGASDSAFLAALRVNRRLRVPAIVAVALLILGTAGAMGYASFVAFPRVWHWGFDQVTWRMVPAVILELLLTFIPLLPFIYTPFLSDVLRLYVEEQEVEVAERLDMVRTNRAHTEEALVDNDDAKLIPLIKYSRLQLEEYYTIGLAQTQRSFRYSILAMWIGFLVIIGGIALYFIPFIVPSHALDRDIHLITIATGAVIEVVSASFLWIYRSSINQMNHYYDRQLYTHNVAMAMRIAASMKDGDESKRYIVKRVLDPPRRSERAGRLPKSGAAKDDTQASS